MTEADRAQSFLLTNQPDRVLVQQIGFIQGNRGGQGILPPHVHTIALDVVTSGTSERRYGLVSAEQ